MFFILDTNFFRSLCDVENEQAIQTWLGETAQLRAGFDQPAEYEVTPFMLLEMVGVVPPLPKPFSVPAPLQKLVDENPASTEELKHFVFRRAHKFYKMHRKVKANFIRRNAELRLQYFSKPGQEMFDHVLGGVLRRRRLEKDLHHRLALEFVTKYSYPANAQRYIDQSLIIDVFRGPSHGWDFTALRASRAMWNTIFPKVVKAGIFESETVSDIIKGTQLKRSRDLLDTELIHFAVMGKVRSGRLWQVHCFTCDSEKNIRFRIGMYKSALNFTREFIEKLPEQTKRRIPFELYEPQSGVVHICDRYGKVITSIETAKIGSLDDWASRKPVASTKVCDSGNLCELGAMPS